MKKNKSNNIIVLSIIAIIFVASLVVFILNYSRDDYSFSLIEKKWIKDNTSNVIDISVYNDVPIYGQNGQGIIFDYLDKFTSDYDISFNKVSYMSKETNSKENIAFRVLDNETKLSDQDIPIFEDTYVIVTKDDLSITSLDDLSSQKLGVLSSDLNSVSYYLYSQKPVSLTSYDNIRGMWEALDNKDVIGVVIPKIMYIDSILEKKLHIVYHLNDMSKKYVLSVNNNDTLLGIMKKFNKTYMQENYQDSYKANYSKTIFQGLDISEAEIANYNSAPYTLGYVMYMPYTYNDNNEFVGTMSNYIRDFEEYFNVDFKIQKYDSIASLKQALSHGEVDLAFANFSTDNLNIDTINSASPFNEEYVVLAHDNMVVNTIRSLKDNEVYTVTDSLIYEMLRSNNIKVNDFSNTDELLRNINNDSIVVVDKGTYDYYRNKKFSNYNIVYTGILPIEYHFVTRDVNKNETFSQIFNTYISMNDYAEIRYDYQTTSGISGSGLAMTIAKYLLITVIILIIIGAIILTIYHKKKQDKKISKEEKLKFIDMMTSLKNRNYLNYNMKKWEENVIYPQAIVVIDLNNIKYINDNFGHEEGDNVIKKAASILIVNQLENTDIIRTDGNEFLIYMVGYSEKDVITLSRKLYKELKELPHEFGASIGYSMITDDLKTIDDAINEAVIDMQKGK